MSQTNSSKLNFASFHKTRRERLVARLTWCVAQSNAARALLESAESRGLKRADFWRDALDFAEDEESRARKVLASFDSRDFDEDRRAFDFAQSLRPMANKEFRKLQNQSA